MHLDNEVIISFPAAGVKLQERIQKSPGYLKTFATRWNILYFLFAAQDRVPARVWLETGDRIGHPACEGGISAGSHFHLACKYNGEWVAAFGALPMTMSGWMPFSEDRPYRGGLEKRRPRG